MTLRNAVFIAFLLFGPTACMGSLSTKHPPDYYGLDYPVQAADCGRNEQGGLRVWSFTASAPFNRAEMVITDPSRQVRYSAKHQWVAPPGEMIADVLLRDLSRNSMFSKTVSAGDPFIAQNEMSGHIFRFGWEELNSQGRAILEVEVSLWREKPKRAVLFRKHYRLESEPLAELSPEAFARTMSGLVQRLSMQFQQDICTIPSGSSSPAGG